MIKNAIQDIQFLARRYEDLDQLYMSVDQESLDQAIKALMKQEPQKPTFVDTRFRQRGKFYGEYTTIDRCYKCPTCLSHIFYDYESEIYCPHCGQRLDWEGELRS